MSATDPRLVVVVLRGAMDGLAVLQPYGDANLPGLRAPLCKPQPGASGGLFDLGGFFGLHPLMPKLAGMYQDGQAIAFHAIGGPYRTRSHFEAQALMESAAGITNASPDGFLNRMLAYVPDGPSVEAGLAVGNTAPHVIRGPEDYGGISKADLDRPPSSLMLRVAEFAALSERPFWWGLVDEALQARLYAWGVTGSFIYSPTQFVAEAQQAAMLLARDDGPRVAALDLVGWDTHARQNEVLPEMVTQLDAALGALRDGLGAAWAHTAVFVISEFGRRAAANGAGGSDHGTGGAAFLVGGAVDGGRVIADWPGLGAGQLYAGMDLDISTDYRAVLKGVLAEHMGFDAAEVEATLPGTLGLSAVSGLFT